jgi:hypothetical protein
MALTGGCYCGAVRYEAAGDPVVAGQCTCRECRYITGGSENLFLMMPAEGFKYVKGQPKTFRRADLTNPVTREFCPSCGTHLVTRTADPRAVVLKVGGLDDPSVYSGPQIAVFTSEALPYHLFPDGVTRYATLPGR